MGVSALRACWLNFLKWLQTLCCICLAIKQDRSIVTNSPSLVPCMLTERFMRPAHIGIKVIKLLLQELQPAYPISAFAQLFAAAAF